ncbi:MAG: hypothetical protein GPJ54_13025 [Candidatus Heimdallarchaeota archaeon]|nr:hypothetical protein [Candidatus Heimdallarchaeota archaeon]
MAETISIIDIISTIVLILPSTVLLRNYLKTRMVDYLYFALFFILGGLGLFVISLNAERGELYLVVISHALITTSTLVLFLHAIKLKWEKRPNLLFFVGIIWYLFQIFTYIFYETFGQPERARVILIELPRTLSGTHPNGAGWKIDDTIISSSSFNQIWYLYLIFTLIITIYSYLTSDIINPTNRIVRARRLWLGAWLSYLFYALLGIGFESLFVVADSLILVAVLIIAYISFTLPEAIFITRAQIYHATDLYQKFLEIDAGKEKSRFGFSELIEYIQNVPKEYLKSN